MKKFISITLCLVMIFSFAVPSFAMSITNWPEYFTGQYDNAIYSKLQDIFEDVAFLADTIETMYGNDLLFYNASTEQMKLEVQMWDLYMEWYEELSLRFSGINSAVGSIYSLMQTQHWELMDYYSEEMEPNILSAISGVTSAVNADANWNMLNYYNTSDIYADLWEQFNTHQEGYLGYSLYMLQQVLADEQDLEFKEANAEQKEYINEFSQGGVDGGGGSSVSFLDSGIKSIDFLSSFFEFFDFGIDPIDIFTVFSDDEAWIWFSERNYSEINGIATFSRNEPEIVTNYYEENKEALRKRLGGVIGG